MSKETIVLEAEIKSNIGEVSKETKELTNNFGAFGITIGGIKDKFKDVSKIMMNGLKQVALQARLAGVGFKKMFSGDIIGGAKTLFTVIKTGIAATGIGLIIVAFGSLVAYLTQTKKGAELLEKTLKTMGAAISVITDRVAKLGGAVVKFFSGDLKGAAEDARAAVSGVVAEITAEVSATNKMVTANQKLRDSQRELNVETAQSIAEIEKLKLIAEDITKGYKEREEAATQAFEKETDLENKRIALAEEAVELEKERHRIIGKDGVLAEDLDALSELEITLANVRQESAGRQISLQNFLNGLRNEELAKVKEIRDAEIARAKEKQDQIAAELKATQDLYDAQIAQADALGLQFEKLSNEEKDRLKSKKDFEIDMANQGLSALATAAGEGTALAKAAAIAQATISGVQGVQNAFTAANANIGATAGTFGAYPVAMATLAGTFAAINIAKIASGGKPGGGGGASGGGGVAAATPAPQMMSGAFDISGGVAPEATKAYVVTDEMSNSQNQLANIRRRATI
jgi:hypothetical protein